MITHIFKRLHRRKPKLSRDIVLMLNADEESSAKFGARWMVDNQRSKIDAEFVINEDARRNPDKDGRVDQLSSQAAEKIYNDVWIRTRGESQRHHEGLAQGGQGPARVRGAVVPKHFEATPEVGNRIFTRGPQA